MMQSANRYYRPNRYYRLVGTIARIGTIAESVSSPESVPPPNRYYRPNRHHRLIGKTTRIPDRQLEEPAAQTQLHLGLFCVGSTSATHPTGPKAPPKIIRSPPPPRPHPASARALAPTHKRDKTATYKNARRHEPLRIITNTQVKNTNLLRKPCKHQNKTASSRPTHAWEGRATHTVEGRRRRGVARLAPGPRPAPRCRDKKD